MSTPDPWDVRSNPMPPDLALAPGDAAPFDDDELARVLAVRSVDPDAAADTAPARFHIDNDGAAEWAMRKLQIIQTELARTNAQAAAWHDQIDGWALAIESPLRRSAAFFEAHLTEYQRQRRATDPKAKTLTLPSGKVGSTVKNPRPVIVDMDAVVEWAEHQDDLPDGILKVESKVMVGELKKILDLVEVEVARRFTVHLVCGHDVVVTMTAAEEAAGAQSPGLDPLPCAECADPIDGVPLVEPRTTTVERITEFVAVAPGGERLPGVAVDPGDVSFSVVPNG